MRNIHFLHLSKAAGTQIWRLVEQINTIQQDSYIIVHDHGIGLKDLPSRDAFFFSIRDPVTRFRSAFYARLRRGRPLYNAVWTVDETRAFNAFEHANDLAEALFDAGQRGREAFFAMRSIGHVSTDQVGWFMGCGDFLETRPPLWIIRKENFVQDVDVLLEKLGCQKDIRMSDPVAANKADYTGIPELSELAIENLRRWYVRDCVFYRLCLQWMEYNAN